MYCFWASPLDCLTPGAGGTADAGGVRESGMVILDYVNASWTWTLTYGAGDGTSGSAGHWKPQYATWTDGGLTYVAQHEVARR